MDVSFTVAGGMVAALLRKNRPGTLTREVIQTLSRDKGEAKS